MSAIWENISAFWGTYGPWIGASLIPTIIVGLTLSPKTKAAASFVEKAWGVFKQIMDFLSVVTHKDKPGTFQLPLKLGEVLKKDDTKGTTGLVLVICVSIMQPSCGPMGSGAKGAKEAAINCAMESVQTNARSLVPALVGILTGGAINWKEQVTVFTKEFGRDATACALQVAMQKIESPVQSEPEEDRLQDAKAGAERAKEYISSEKWTFVEE